MADPQDPRVAVYLDFDNIVMSWYDRVHGRQAYSRDRHRIAEDPTEPEIAERLAKATVDVGAVIDFADELIGARFTIENPNAASSCGCGTSFSI